MDNNREEADRLMELVYGQLRALARARMASERTDHTLQPTALVHEVFCRMVDQRTPWKNESHFMGVAAEVMRNMLVDHARGKATKKRGGPGRGEETGAPCDLACRVQLDQVADRVRNLSGVDVLALENALGMLREHKPELARVVVMKFYGGLTVEQMAEALGLAPRTVEKYWAEARTFLFGQLREADAEG